MAVTLPDDIWHLICEELWFRRDFDSLYQCAVASKRLTHPALANLYRMHNVAPATSRGADDLELARQGKSGRERMVQKWALMWRSIILSSLGKTLFPYCRYTRALDLRDLEYLFDDGRFRGTADRQFFAGDLAQFNIEADTPKKPTSKSKAPRRLNVPSVLDRIGEVVTKETPILEELSGRISSKALPQWTSRLPRLQSLELWQGEALAEGAQDSIHAHCPLFKRLAIYQWLGDEVDGQLSAFLSGMRPQTLTSFEVFSAIDIGTESYTSLALHQQSLTTLRLSGLRTDAVLALSELKSCTSLEVLHLEAIEYISEDPSQKECFLDLISWLRECKRLQNVTVKRFRSAHSLLAPFLLENDTHVTKLEVDSYLMHEASDFHCAIGSQLGLQSLKLHGTSQEMDLNDMEVLVDSASRLKWLRRLELRQVPVSFGDAQIRQLARQLTRLEDLYTDGYDITDAIWPDMAGLQHLRSLTFIATTSFSVKGLLGFIPVLGPGNQGLALSVDNADPETGSLSEDEQERVREAISEKVGGRFTLSLQPGAWSESSGDSD
ncbi:MAG: hypothetical protein M1833_006915 [Piccolia ochrophora]|nr:MAG: hypothetical protein M1833_006915 [Piccolia ochrophora]